MSFFSHRRLTGLEMALRRAIDPAVARPVMDFVRTCECVQGPAPEAFDLYCALARKGGSAQ